MVRSKTSTSIWPKSRPRAPNRRWKPIARWPFSAKTSSPFAPSVPLDVTWQDCAVHTYNRTQVEALFDELEFKTLRNRLPGGGEAKGEAPPPAKAQQISMFGETEAPQPASAKQTAAIDQPIESRDERRSSWTTKRALKVTGQRIEESRLSSRLTQKRREPIRCWPSSSAFR